MPQHAGSWRRRSLIDDAKFDTITNAEFEKAERERSSTTEDSSDEQRSEEQQHHGEDDDVFAVPNGDVHSPNLQASHRKCNLLLSLRDMAVLSRIFKLFEVQ